MPSHNLAQILLGESLRPFERMATPKEFVRFAEKIIASGWKLGKTQPVFLDDRNDWSIQGRSHSFHLHAWDPIDPLLASYCTSKDETYLERALPFAKSWLTRFQQPVIYDEVAISLTSRDGMAWYDMSVGQRVYRLAYLMDASLRAHLLNDDVFDLMAQSILFHMQLLSIDDFFIFHNNHGLYQALGQMAVVKRLGRSAAFSRFKEQAEERLALMVNKSFFRSGAHTEHSPGYHRMILATLKAAIDADLVSEGDTRQTIHRAIEVEKWMTKPDGRLVGFGDTDPVVVSANAPKENGVLILKDAGYVFAKTGPSYFAQSAAFHSRTHKHADHLNFVWHDKGNDILVDPGRYGYEGKTVPGDELNLQGFYYSDPKRIYVERTRAHNCVEIGGKDYLRRGVSPFGSALEYASFDDGLLTTLCQIRHPGHIRHFRNIVWKPGFFIIVMDWLKIGTDESHNFRQWFQMAPEWDVNATAETVSAAHPSGMKIQATSLLDGPRLDRIRIGEDAPEMSGWFSNGPLSLIPSPSLNWYTEENSSAVFATIFSISEILQPLPHQSKISDNFTNGNLRWSDGQFTHALKFTRSTVTQNVEVNLSSTPLTN